MFAGAGLCAGGVGPARRALRERTVGERIRIFTGLGMTETAPSLHLRRSARDVRSGHIGLPCPGVEVKLVPTATSKREVRFRGPNVMPGYWREPEQTRRGLRRRGLLPHRRCRALRSTRPTRSAA